MQIVHEQQIRENLTALVDLTSNVEDILKVLKEKEVISQEEEEKILAAGSPFDTKAQLYWLITKKDDKAFGILVVALRSTGNGEAADKLQDKLTASEVVEVEVNVALESSNSDKQDGIGFDIEKEFERIQSEVESEQDQPEQSPEAEIASALVSEVFQEALEKAYDQPETTMDDDEVSERNEVESHVRVEVTPPPESDREGDEDIDDSVEEKVEISETKSIDNVGDNIIQWKNRSESVEEEEPKSADIEVIEAEEPPKEVRKQVKFESPKEFVIKKEDSEDSEAASEASISPNSKSLVQQNREKFEQHTPAGVKVKYSFRKNEAVEEPKESTVKNLRNFFQKLGSIDNEDVKARSNTKMGGVHPNRKSMAS